MIEQIDIKKVKENPNNPRTITKYKLELLVKSIKEFPEMLKLRPIVVNEEMVVLGGNMRLRACKKAKLKKVYILKAEHLTEAQQKEFIIKDNNGFGEWNWDELRTDWAGFELGEWGLENPAHEIEKKPKEVHGKLHEKFLVPPFSILDTRQGYWNDRKRFWHAKIQDNGESREGTLAKGDTNIMAAMNNGVSLLDPVLAEMANLWFGVPGGNTFDCFAGDSVFGYVSNELGNTFTGIELRQEQADLNNARIAGSASKYICDDGQNVLKHIKPGTQDFLFSCPPYFDLEVYSDLPNDASNQGDYQEFLQILDNAFSDAIKCLKNNRFAFITVGDIRDKNGNYYRFPDHIKDIFERNDMPLYNEMILVEPLGTLPQRVGRYMNNRKVGKCHQNILVFYKGDTKEIKNEFNKIDLNIEDESTDA